VSVGMNSSRGVGSIPASMLSIIGDFYPRRTRPGGPGKNQSTDVGQEKIARCDVFREASSPACGMLVASGFCYRMLLDESCIARESQNSLAPARASDRLLSIGRFLVSLPRPFECCWMRSHRALHHRLDAAERIGVGERDGQVAEEQGGVDLLVGSAGPRQRRIPGG
jgi:hypothetical protein